MIPPAIICESDAPALDEVVVPRSFTSQPEAGTTSRVDGMGGDIRQSPTNPNARSQRDLRRLGLRLLGLAFLLAGVWHYGTLLIGARADMPIALAAVLGWLTVGSLASMLAGTQLHVPERG